MNNCIKYLTVTIIIIIFSGCKKEERIINNSTDIEKKVFGKIYCETYPVGAKIYVDSIFTGKLTPSVIDSLTEGIHAVEFKRNYFSPFATATQVRFNTVPAVRCTLKQTLNTSNYFPLTVGSSWIFQRSDTGTSKNVDTVSFIIANIDSTFNKVIGSLWIEKYKAFSQTYTDSLIAYISNDTVNIIQKYYSNSPVRSISFPLFNGKVWKVAYDEYKVDTIETIVTKAGVFENCFKVRQVSTIPNTYGWFWYWIHPQKGIVKIYDYDGFYGVYRIWDLISFYNAQ